MKWVKLSSIPTTRTGRMILSSVGHGNISFTPSRNGWNLPIRNELAQHYGHFQGQIIPWSILSLSLHTTSCDSNTSHFYLPITSSHCTISFLYWTPNICLFNHHSRLILLLSLPTIYTYFTNMVTFIRVQNLKTLVTIYHSTQLQPRRRGTSAIMLWHTWCSEIYLRFI